MVSRLLLVFLVLPIGWSHALFFPRLLCRGPFFRRIFPGICDGNDDDDIPSPIPPPSERTNAPSTPTVRSPTRSNATSTPTVRSPTRSNATSTTKPTFAPTTPRSFSLQAFQGITNAYSMKKGKIEIEWDETYLEEFSEITFHVFVAPLEYNYTNVLHNGSVPSLVTIFQRTPTFQYYNFSQTSNVTVDSSLLGVKHSALVMAQVGLSYSNNTRPTLVNVATTSPRMKERINVVGVFFPTSRLVIKVDSVPRGTIHTLSFIGPVSHQARNLTVGDYLTGFNSQLDPFVKIILGINQNTPNLVILRVNDVNLEDIFAELDLDSSFEVSRTGGSEARRRRRLFDFGGWINDNIVKPVVNDVFIPIGDAVVNTVENVVDFFDDGQFEDQGKWSIVDIDQQWDYEITNPSPATLLIKGNANADVSLYGRIRVAGFVPVFADVGVTASYEMATTLIVSAGEEQTYNKAYDIWKGRTYSTIIFVGQVPIVLSAQPSLVFEVDASASLTAEMTVGFSAKGGSSMGVIYDLGSNPVGRPMVVPPQNDFDYTFPTLQGTASFKAGAGVVLKITVGLYFGLVEADIGLRGGLDADVAGGVIVVGPNVLPSVSAFDLSIGLAIPISARINYVFGTYTIPTGPPVWQTTWPIIALPTTSIKLKDNHRCRLGTNGAVASFSIQAEPTYSFGAPLVENKIIGSDWYFFSPVNNGWSINKRELSLASFQNNGIVGSSSEPNGLVAIAMQPQFPPLLKVVKTVSLDSLFPPEPVTCTDPAPCDGDDFFNKLSQMLAPEFNSKIFLSQPPIGSLVPSTVYKFEDFMQALKKLQTAGPAFKFWLGDDCSIESQKAAFVNMAAFLGQAMRETIIFNACDENNWDLWRADIFKEPTSPKENLAALYPMSSGCGQLGQKYAEYNCPDECPQNLQMEVTATTHATWIGVPPPLFCGPKSKYDGLGYWNPQKFCGGTDRTCVGEPFYYAGQSAGVHVPVSEDNRYPEFYYKHPLKDRNGFTPNERSAFPATNVEGCCWWGRGVIQTTGRCNFGKLNKQIGAGAGSTALYPTVNFCTNPQAICTGPRDLKWVAGIFFWVTEPQTYNRDGFNYLDGVKAFVAKGCAEKNVDPNRAECNELFEYASGIVNRGCHNPGGGCPNCTLGATCDPAHNVPERVTASKQALQALLQYIK